MVAIMPGANIEAKDAPFAALVIDGGPEEPACTVTVNVAADAEYAESPLYCALMVLVPDCSCEPLMLNDAVAVAPEPERRALPSWVPPAENETVPDGVAVAVPVTVAVIVTDPPAVTVVELALSEMDGVVADGVDDTRPSLQAVTRLYASTDPSPVTGSYPAPV
jgi:hypothetical protein